MKFKQNTGTLWSNCRIYWDKYSRWYLNKVQAPFGQTVEYIGTNILDGI